MPIRISPLLALVSAGVTGAALRLVAWRRGRGLQALATRQGAQWMALCRVMRGGHFLDHGRGRRGAGPRATLVPDGSYLEYTPDGYEQRHGDRPMSWRLADIECLSQRKRRDITGLALEELQLRFPQGTAFIAIIAQTGTHPFVDLHCRKRA